jgi:hypothetical protein
MRSKVSILSLLALILVLSGCARTLPVYNVTDAPVESVSGAQVTQAKVGDAIAKAANDKGWLVNRVSDGHIEATIHVRQHAAVVDIRYFATSYDITYKSSDVLLYDGEKIHRNYNKWIKILEQRINNNISSL